jgi:hypothetical protein
VGAFERARLLRTAKKKRGDVDLGLHLSAPMLLGWHMIAIRNAIPPVLPLLVQQLDFPQDRFSRIGCHLDDRINANEKPPQSPGLRRRRPAPDRVLRLAFSHAALVVSGPRA